MTSERCTCRPGRDHDGSEFGPCEFCEANVCPKCGEGFRMAWIGNNPPEPYGEVCGCPDDEYEAARDEKRAMDREAGFFNREMQEALRLDAQALRDQGVDVDDPEFF